MFHLSLKTLLLISGFAVAASATTMNGTITGTCGFYQGTPSNVVYSQTFSGDGTFCTGFMPGGYFTNSGTLQVGDVFASATNSLLAIAPVGYGAFVQINSTYQVTQQYLFTPLVSPTTATGTIRSSLSLSGGTDDGSGNGICSEQLSLNDQSTSNYNPTTSQLILPVTFGSPVSITETASLTCNISFTRTANQFGFGDSGLRRFEADIFGAYDSNGNYIGPALYTTITPEPATCWITALLGVALYLAGLAVRRRKECPVG